MFASFRLQMATRFSDEQMEQWFQKSMEQRSEQMLSYFDFCAKQGLVNHLKENLDYYKLDVIIDMMEMMRKEGNNVHFNNVVHIFEFFVYPKMDAKANRFLLNAMRKQMTPSRSSSRNKQ